MGEERMRILKMLEEGKLTVEEANELLENIENRPHVSSQDAVNNKKIKKVRILVKEQGEEKVNITLPFSLARTALKFVPRKVMNNLDEGEIDLKEMLNTLENDLDPNTPLVNVHDGDDHVLIMVE